MFPADNLAEQPGPAGGQPLEPLAEPDLARRLHWYAIAMTATWLALLHLWLWPCFDLEVLPPVKILFLSHTASRQMVEIVEPAVNELVGLGPVRLHADVATNSVIVDGATADFEALRSIFEHLDVPVFHSANNSLPRVLVETLLSSARDDAEQVALYCHVVEGCACIWLPRELISSYQGEYDAELERNGLPRPLARLIVYVLGWKYVEHARGNGIKLRCRRDRPGRCSTCSWDRGNGWEPLRIVP